MGGLRDSGDMYLDTAVLVKLFVPEPDSAYFGKAVDGQVISSSWLAYTEFWSALLGKERAGAITPEQRQWAWHRFARHVEEEEILLLPLTPAVFKKANHILERCHPEVPLRSLDALHLASCDQLQDWPLCTTDKRMRAAAEVLSFQLL
jgi:predicted nucleic acid-binding protein